MTTRPTPPLTDSKEQQVSKGLGAGGEPRRDGLDPGGDGCPALHAWTDDCDTVIAASLDDAMAVLDEFGMYDPDPECWGQVDDADEVTIHCDAAGTPAQPGDEGVAPITKTAAEWAKRGRGFLCTTEY